MLVIKNRNFDNISDLEIDLLNSFIYKNKQSTLFHTFDWNKAIKSYLGINGIILMAFQGNTLVGSYIYFENSKFLFFRVTQGSPLETPYGGPISKENNSEILKALIVKHDALTKSIISYVPTSPYWNSDALDDLGYEIEASGQEVSIINLEKETDKQFSMFNKKKRWDINKGIKGGVQVSLVKNRFISSYYQMLEKTFEKFNKDPIPKSFFEHLAENLPKGMFNIYLASHGEEILSGMIILKWRKESYYWSSVSTGRKRSLQSTSILIWRAIQDLISENYSSFDLLGMGIKPVKDFKSSFNGRLKKYNSYTKKSKRWSFVKKLANFF